jgi:hypothetical protein
MVGFVGPGGYAAREARTWRVGGHDRGAVPGGTALPALAVRPGGNAGGVGDGRAECDESERGCGAEPEEPRDADGIAGHPRRELDGDRRGRRRGTARTLRRRGHLGGRLTTIAAFALGSGGVATSPVRDTRNHRIASFCLARLSRSGAETSRVGLLQLSAGGRPTLRAGSPTNRRSSNTPRRRRRGTRSASVALRFQASAPRPPVGTAAGNRPARRFRG